MHRFGLNPLRISVLFCWSFLVACGGSSDPAPGSSPASTTTAASTPAKPGAEPAKTAPANAVEKVDNELVACTWTKKYSMCSTSAKECAEFECKSAATKDMDMIQFKVYYYDKTKKQVTTMMDARNGKGILKAGETKKFSLGKEKPDLPAGVETIQVEAANGVYADGGKWENPKLGLPDREMK